METILFKGLHRNFPPNCDLFLDVKMENGGYGKKQKT